MAKCHWVALVESTRMLISEATADAAKVKREA
jgi:hypothetical protein